jgi:hypothetical protein
VFRFDVAMLLRDADQIVVRDADGNEVRHLGTML